METLGSNADSRTEADDVEEHDLGLAHDVAKLMGRRRALGLVGGLAIATVAGCASGSKAATSSSSSDSSGSTTSTNSTTSTTTNQQNTGGPGQGGPGGGGGAPPSGGDGGGTAVETGTIPQETAGPYPGDGSNGPNVLTESGIVRSDITSSFGDASGTAEGVPLTVKLKLLDLSDSSKPVAGAAIYAWHCNRNGNYSMYTGDAKNENYLRGVQVTDDDGVVTFKTIFPAAYSGRWPHIHFEVYESLDIATQAGSKLRTSQLAMPEDACNTVYATTGYEQSVKNMKQTSLANDNVFSDGYSLQLATVTGSVSAGLTATLNVPI